MQSLKALQTAVSIAGGQTELARRMREGGSSAQQQNINYWLKTGYFPAHEVIHIARAVEWGVTPHTLDDAAYPNPWDGLPVQLALELMPRKATV